MTKMESGRGFARSAVAQQSRYRKLTYLFHNSAARVHRVSARI